MSLGISAAGWLGLALTTGTALHQSNIASKQQTSAQNQAKAAADKAASDADQAMNAANRKAPDIGAILRANANGRGGVSGTMLTGPSGVDTASLSLGKSTLLGG